MSAPVFPDPELDKVIHVMWMMVADIRLRDYQPFTDAQGQPRDPELLDEATLIELANEVISEEVDVFLPLTQRVTQHDGTIGKRETDYDIISSDLSGEVTPY